MKRNGILSLVYFLPILILARFLGEWIKYSSKGLTFYLVVATTIFAILYLSLGFLKYFKLFIKELNSIVFQEEFTVITKSGRRIHGDKVYTIGDHTLAVIEGDILHNVKYRDIKEVLIFNKDGNKKILTLKEFLDILKRG